MSGQDPKGRYPVLWKDRSAEGVINVEMFGTYPEAYARWKQLRATRGVVWVRIACVLTSGYALERAQ